MPRKKDSSNGKFICTEGQPMTATLTIRVNDEIKTELTSIPDWQRRLRERLPLIIDEIKLELEAVGSNANNERSNC